MTTDQLIAIDSICLTLLVVVIYFTRAVPQRVLGAAVGGLVAMAIGIGFDVLGEATGWSHYTIGTTTYGLPLMYLAVWLWYGVGVQLIGWRVSRRFGRRGLISFTGFMAVYGPLRDYIGVELTQGRVQVISWGILPVVADVVLWASFTAVAQSVMWLIAGSPESDQFARGPFRLVTRADRYRGASSARRPGR
jgi:hypothetical protein